MSQHYFDLAKAFDTVPHERLVSKLKNVGINGTLLKWLKNYLQNRTFFVRVGSAFSDEFPCLSGVPQGSNLGPLLFLIYISDLPNFCKTENVEIKLFADDLKAYSILSKNTISPLHSFINKFRNYCELNGLKIAPNKCLVSHLGPKNPNECYFINNIPILKNEKGEPVRDLGIYFSNDLKWEKHIEYITKKAIRTSFTLLKSLKTKNPKILINILNVYCQSILEFGSPVFNPYMKKDIDALENVQKTFLRIVFRRNNNKDDIPGYNELLQLFKQESLLKRRIKIDLRLFHDIILEKIHIQHNDSFSRTYSGLKNDFIIKTAYCSTNVRYHSFFIRTSRLYRYLPKEARLLNSIEFAKLLDTYDVDALILKPPHLIQ